MNKEIELTEAGVSICLEGAARNMGKDPIGFGTVAALCREWFDSHREKTN